MSCSSFSITCSFVFFPGMKKILSITGAVMLPTLLIVGIVVGVVLHYRKKRRGEEVPQEESENVSMDKMDESPESKRKPSLASPYKCALPNMTCGVVNPNLTSSMDSPSSKCNGYADFNSSFANNSGDSFESPYSQISSVGSGSAQSPPPPVYQSNTSLIAVPSAGTDLRVSPATIRRSPACMLRMAGRTIVNHSRGHSNVWTAHNSDQPRSCMELSLSWFSNT